MKKLQFEGEIGKLDKWGTDSWNLEWYTRHFWTNDLVKKGLLHMRPQMFRELVFDVILTEHEYKHGMTLDEVIPYLPWELLFITPADNRAFKWVKKEHSALHDQIFLRRAYAHGSPAKWGEIHLAGDLMMMGNQVRADNSSGACVMRNTRRCVEQLIYWIKASDDTTLGDRTEYEWTQLQNNQ